MKYNYGDIAACKYCYQDIQNNGNKQWVDRGGNRPCCPYVKNGEVINPKTKHAPYKGLHNAK